MQKTCIAKEFVVALWQKYTIKWTDQQFWYSKYFQSHDGSYVPYSKMIMYKIMNKAVVVKDITFMQNSVW